MHINEKCIKDPDKRAEWGPGKEINWFAFFRNYFLTYSKFSNLWDSFFFPKGR